MRGLVLALGMALAGCVADYDFVECGDVTCSAGQQCTGRGCVPPGDVAACDNLPASSECQSAVGAGYCDLEGVCYVPDCGNNIVEDGEVCDDGTENGAPVGGDGCSDDCKSNETCDNGTLDSSIGEQCESGLRGLSRDGCSSQCGFEVNSWTLPTITEFSVRAGAAYATDTRRNRVVMFGGRRMTDLPMDETWEWDGATWLKQAPQTTPPPRSNAAMAYHPGLEKTYLYGGENSAGLLNDLWQWDGQDWSEVTQSMTQPGARSSAILAYHPSNGIVLYGGHSAAGCVNNCAATWSFSKGTWRLHPVTAPNARTNASAIYVEDYGVVLFGGQLPNSSAVVAETWRWDGTAWSIVNVSPASPPGRADASLAVDGATVTLFGGRGPNSLNDTWRWTLAGGWAEVAIPLSSRPLRRYEHVMGVVDGVVVIASGQSAGKLDDTHQLEAAAWTRVAERSEPEPRFDTASFYDRLSGDVVVYGGKGGLGGAPGTWLWNGVQWRRLRAYSPPERRLHAIAYDRARGEAIMFGGLVGEDAVNQTFKFRDGAWASVPPLAPLPAPRYGHMLAYDEVRRRIVMFGGVIPGTDIATSETWEWTGTSWEQSPTTVHPPARYGSAMAFDAFSQRIVLVGGIPVGNGPPILDTWTYANGQWEQVALSQDPPGFVNHAMTTDERNGRVMLFGGSDLVDMWSWDAVARHWYPIPLASSPVPRASLTMVYDSLRGEVLAFGGRLGSAPSSTLWRYGYQLVVNPPDQCEGADTDGDGLVNCLDPDCDARCQPLCPIGTPIEASCGDGPTCGDGECTALETRLLCPNDNCP